MRRFALGSTLVQTWFLNNFRPLSLNSATRYLMMVYENSINARVSTLHKLHNGILKTKSRYIIGTREQVKVAA